VHLRAAQDQGLAQCCKGPAAMGVGGNLEQHQQILRFQLHTRLFAIREQRISGRKDVAASRPPLARSRKHTSESDKPMQASVCTNANCSIRRRSSPTRRQPSRDGMCRSVLRPRVQARISPVQPATSDRGS
jgi:hypothetical protein